MKIVFALFLTLIVFASANCNGLKDSNGKKYKLNAIASTVFKQAGLPDDGSDYDYEYSLCTDEVACSNGAKASLCQEWDNGNGKSSLGKFASVTAGTNAVVFQLTGGDDIPGRGPRTATITVNCDKKVKKINLVSVHYAGTGVNYNAIAQSTHACAQGGGAGGAIVVIIIILLILGGVGGAVYWFVIKPRMDSQI